MDEDGAADLARGLGLPVAPGLVYAGQAGATHWPSGRRSRNTLWGRIAGMHLGGAAEFSTFRRTLAAILGSVLPLETEDDPRLSTWISEHLRVIAVQVSDADGLGQVESTVLDTLDPPLNLRGRPPSAIRLQLTRLRRADGTEPAGIPDEAAVAEPPPSAEPSLKQTERDFHRAMVAICETARRDLGYNATRFLQMISEHGGLAAASQLIWSDKPSEGFTALWSHQRLDLTVEALVLRDDFAALFTEPIVRGPAIAWHSMGGVTSTHRGV